MKKYMEKFIFYLITQKVTEGNRPGFLGWLARQFNHPYGWVSAISAKDFQALQKLAEHWKIYE